MEIYRCGPVTVHKKYEQNVKGDYCLPIWGKILEALIYDSLYSKSPHIRTYFFEREAETAPYFQGTNTNLKV